MDTSPKNHCSDVKGRGMRRKVFRPRTMFVYASIWKRYAIYRILLLTDGFQRFNYSSTNNRMYMDSLNTCLKVQVFPTYLNSSYTQHIHCWRTERIFPELVHGTIHFFCFDAINQKRRIYIHTFGVLARSPKLN